MIKLPRGSVGEAQAINEMHDLLGFDLRQVLSEDDWSCVLIKNEPQVVVTVDGVRAIARFAPDQRKAAELVAQIESFQQREG